MPEGDNAKIFNGSLYRRVCENQPSQHLLDRPCDCRSRLNVGKYKR